MADEVEATASSTTDYVAEGTSAADEGMTQNASWTRSWPRPGSRRARGRPHGRSRSGSQRAPSSAIQPISLSGRADPAARAAPTAPPRHPPAGVRFRTRRTGLRRHEGRGGGEQGQEGKDRLHHGGIGGRVEDEQRKCESGVAWGGGGRGRGAALCEIRNHMDPRRSARQVPESCSLKKMRSTWREKVPLSSIPQTKQNTSETDYDYIGIGLSWSAHPCKHRSRMGSRRLEHPTGGGSDVLANVAPPPRTRGTDPSGVQLLTGR